MKRLSLALALTLVTGFAHATCIKSKASYYKRCFGTCATANGEQFNKHALTAAHKSLPFGTKVTVTNLHNNKQTIVHINDRGPFVKGRDLDLSYGAMKRIKGIKRGVVQVKYCY